MELLLIISYLTPILKIVLLLASSFMLTNPQIKIGLSVSPRETPGVILPHFHPVFFTDVMISLFSPGRVPPPVGLCRIVRILCVDNGEIEKD